MVFTHSRGSDTYAETKSLSFFIGFIGSMSLSVSRCTALFFLLRVSPTGFTAEVLMRPLGLYVFHFFFFFILYGVSLCRSVLLACLLPRSAARGKVLQYLTRSALSRVESRHIRIFRLFTFPLPFSLRQDNTHKTSSFHQTSIIILTASALLRQYTRSSLSTGYEPGPALYPKPLQK